MNWSEFVIKANETLDRKFTIKENDGSVQYYDYDEQTQKDTVIYHTKIMLRRRLALLFQISAVPVEGNGYLFSNTITESESELFLFVLETLPPLKKGEINKLKRLEEDAWEVIPLEERLNLLRLIRKLDDASYCKYMAVENRKDAEHSFRYLTIKLKFPEYYRLLQNTIYLNHILSNEDEILTDQRKKDQIISFEKDLNKLLTKYGERTRGFISPYPRTHARIDSKIALNQAKTTEFINSDEEFECFIEKFIK